MAIPISASIVCYKDHLKAKQTIRSLMNCNPGLDLYIIENGPANKNFARWLEQYEHVRYIPTGKNLGFGAGHNQVLPLIDSKYHAIINPDILLQENSVDKLAGFLDQNPEANLATCNILNPDGSFQQAFRPHPTLPGMFWRLFSMTPPLFAKSLYPAVHGQACQVPFVHGSFLVVRTDKFKESGGFDERYFLYMEDADLCRTLQSVWYDPETAVVHLWEKGSHKSLKLMIWHIQSIFRYFQKWGWL